MNTIDSVIKDFSNDQISLFFQKKIHSFKPEKDLFTNIVNEDSSYSTPVKIGHAELDKDEELLMFTCEYKKDLTDRSAKKTTI